MLADFRFNKIFLPLLALAVGCTEDPPAGPSPARPDFIVYEEAPHVFDGNGSDLLTGGLGLEGLRKTTPPMPPADLRTLAIYVNFRAIVDVTESGGFGRLYGPREDGLLVPGTEYRALARLAHQTHPYAIAVQIPETFERERPCLIIGPSSGSRGLYGAIGTASLWGLTHGCAVALTDKTTGTGAVFLDTGEAYGLALTLTAPSSQEPVLFRIPASGELKAYTAGHPHRLAFKHAHSRENVEKDWGRATLQAARYGLYILNRHFRTPGGDTAFTSHNVTIIAASISNGGAAVLRAGESDEGGLIDGIVASEPNITPASLHGARIVAGGKAVENAGRPLYDYASLMALYAPCAALAPARKTAIWQDRILAKRNEYEAWCQALKTKGLLAGDTLTDLARAASDELRTASFGPESDRLQSASVAIDLWPSIVATYANAYGRFAVEDELCGVSFAYADRSGRPRPASQIEKAILAAVSNGIPPTAQGIRPIYPDTDRNAKLDSMVCFRNLFVQNGQEAQSTQNGIEEIKAQAGLHGIPTIILHGRSDALISVDHASRAYVAAFFAQTPDAENLRYYEIKNGQHFDTLLSLPEFAAHYVPMHIYFDRALDLMMDHLARGAPLPPSQVIRTKPRGSGDSSPPPLSQDNIGEIAHTPGENRIRFEHGALIIPE